jgi:glucokinase
MGAPIACIGSGTGLGECYLTAPRGSEVYDAFPTGNELSTLATTTCSIQQMLQFSATDVQCAAASECAVDVMRASLM